MGELLHVSSSPHIRSKVTTDYLMKMVIVALMPATVAGVCFFGWKALLLVCLSVATCVATEGIYETLMHKPLTIWDGSTVITGLLLGLNLPASAPWWIPVIGGVFAILIVKQLFGGLGQNFMNPALGARCFGKTGRYGIRCHTAGSSKSRRKSRSVKPVSWQYTGNYR